MSHDRLQRSRRHSTCDAFQRSAPHSAPEPWLRLDCGCASTQPHTASRQPAPRTDTACARSNPTPCTPIHPAYPLQHHHHETFRTAAYPKHQQHPARRLYAPTVVHAHPRAVVWQLAQGRGAKRPRNPCGAGGSDDAGTRHTLHATASTEAVCVVAWVTGTHASRVA